MGVAKLSVFYRGNFNLYSNFTIGDWNAVLIRSIRVLVKRVPCHCTHIYSNYNAHTLVSGVLMNENFLRTSIKAIFASNIANLIPMQLRGPNPNGM